MEEDEEETPDWRRLIRRLEGWTRVARAYWMEWGVVWKDVTVGFTLAGMIAVFVPNAFFTFIGSMGNIPPAAVLLKNGVSMAGIMTFIFSDLVVFPVLRVNASYYGWPMALYIAGVFLAALVMTALIVHYAVVLVGQLPGDTAGGPTSGENGTPEQAEGRQAGQEASDSTTKGDDAGRSANGEGGEPSVEERPERRFAIDYTFFLNAVFSALSAAFGWLAWRQNGSGDAKDDAEKKDSQEDEENDGSSDGGGQGWLERTLFRLAMASYAWVAIGLALFAFGVSRGT
ncbi:permease [uncultured Jannaschia sp.]|uniref:permease n=1 Tax=uncultured Jannaschia sp. TaxID=293347 RepID=UPI002624E621|nr:permease [uncultured Jannaschia sp.]